ncbi:PucR family transcriptional regulator [Brevibacterium zhoupengii]|uniref:PucR family transcriptional regulator n=1 Tax=Brevibacterium zhoupengii TaxID=2898795 RepID=UPI001E5FEF7E|nr:helix-turn-helix domain-containing protein [Brevibacterium zhoupengii]
MSRPTGALTSSDANQLVTWAEAQMPRIVTDAFDRIVERIPLYERAEPHLRAEVRRSIEGNLRAAVNAINQRQDTLQLTAPHETGRRRAQQGIPLAEILQANHFSFGVLWDALVEAARPGGDCEAPEAIFAVATWLWSVADAHASALTESYRAASAELLAEEGRRRSALVESLLAGRPSPDCSSWEMATLLGLAPDADLIVVAVDNRNSASRDLANLERTFADQGIVSGWQLTPTLQLGVVSLHSEQHEAALGVLTGIAVRAGVSPPYRSLAETPRALQLARTALSTVRPGQTEVREFNSSPLAALLACEPNEGRRLAYEVLSGVLELPAADRSMMLDTLVAYFDNEGSAERAAEQLYCHSNTVRYRLRRVHELTGRSLKDPLCVAELVSAVFSLRMCKLYTASSSIV